MTDIQHLDAPAGNIHVVYQWSYVDAAARTAATGFVATDAGKVAWQLDDDSLWILTDDSPITWAQIGGGGGGGNTVSTSAYASPPGSPAAGDLWLPTDVPLALRYSGSAWVPWGPLFPLTLPPSAGWSWVNQDTATVDTSIGAHRIENTTDNGGGDSLNLRVRSAPATPYTITALLLPGQAFTGTFQFGLCFRESGTGKIQVFEVYNTSGGANLESTKYTSATALSSTYAFGSGPVLSMLAPLWMRIADDGTSRICSLSGDGQHFYPFHTVARANFLTGGADQVGFFIAPTTGIGGVTLLSWQEA